MIDIKAISYRKMYGTILIAATIIPIAGGLLGRRWNILGAAASVLMPLLLLGITFLILSSYQGERLYYEYIYINLIYSLFLVGLLPFPGQNIAYVEKNNWRTVLMRLAYIFIILIAFISYIPLDLHNLLNGILTMDKNLSVSRKFGVIVYTHSKIYFLFPLAITFICGATYIYLNHNIFKNNQ